jgi:hypothetical protein
MRPWAVVPCKRYALMYIVELLGQDACGEAPQGTELSTPRRCRIPLAQLPAGSHAIEHRLLDEFPAIEEALAPGATEGLIVVCRGHEDVDAWLESVEKLFEPWWEGDRVSWPRQSRRRRGDNGSA